MKICRIWTLMISFSICKMYKSPYSMTTLIYIYHDFFRLNFEYPNLYKAVDGYLLCCADL